MKTENRHVRNAIVPNSPLELDSEKLSFPVDAIMSGDQPGDVLANLFCIADSHGGL